MDVIDTPSNTAAAGKKAAKDYDQTSASSATSETKENVDANTEKKGSAEPAEAKVVKTTKDIEALKNSDAVI